MDAASRAAKIAELNALRARLAMLEEELGEVAEPSGDVQSSWRQSGYLSYFATAGFVLGLCGAMTSLLFNVVGAKLSGIPALKLIQIYLTFGMGERALGLDTNEQGWLAIMIGCCLYAATGMILGIPFQLLFAIGMPKAGLWPRILAGTVLGIAIWLVNYYAILSWLQPLLFGGNWIVNQVPIAVAALTHVVFGWTQALVYPLGAFVPHGSKGR